MAKAQDRKEIVSRIGDAAKLYRDRLVGKRFMYVFDGRYIEVIYKAENFRHLTGVGIISINYISCCPIFNGIWYIANICGYHRHTHI